MSSIYSNHATSIFKNKARTVLLLFWGVGETCACLLVDMRGQLVEVGPLTLGVLRRSSGLVTSIVIL